MKYNNLCLSKTFICIKYSYLSIQKNEGIIIADSNFIVLYIGRKYLIISSTMHHRIITLLVEGITIKMIIGRNLNGLCISKH